MSKVELTISHKLAGDLIIFLHQPQVQRRTISNFIVGIVETPLQQHLNTRLDLRVFLSHAKLGESSDRGCSNNRVFQHNAVVDVSNVLGRLCGLGSLKTKQVQYPHGQLCELAVFDELAQVCECLLLRLRHELDEVEHALHD